MTTHLTAAQVERLRRDAKKLAREKSLPLHEAQRQLASERGFTNWSLMIRASSPASEPQRPSDLPEAAVLARMLNHTSDVMTRFYIHGDAHPDEPDRYFCVRCDCMKPGEHFQAGGEHADQKVNFERFLYSHERWLERRHTNWPNKERPDDAPNLFAEQAYAWRAAYEASRSEFHKWIETQRNRDDAIGDLASDVMRDSTFPVGAATKREVLRHLHRQSIWVIEAVHAAWKAFEDQRRPPPPRLT